MGLVNSALQVGRNALLSYQSALQVIGNNISNAGSPDYVRQTPGLTPMSGPGLAEGMRPGSGVALTSIQRNLDESLENRIRSALGSNESLLSQERAAAMAETLFDPLTGLQLQDKLSQFFNSFSDVQNNPADPAVRSLAVSAGASLAGSLREMRNRLSDIGSDLDQEIETLVDEANRLVDGVAELNTEIVATESFGGPASALRDQRDKLLRELSQLVEISVRTQQDGSVNVYIGNENLVQNGLSRGLDITRRLDGEFSRTSVVFGDTSAQVVLAGGRLEGLIRSRDNGVLDRISDIDALAGAVIGEVNRVHADGQGLEGFTSIVSGRAVSDPSAALSSSSAGLKPVPVNGSFYLAVTDEATGSTTSYQVAVDLDGVDEDTSLESLVADINANASGVTASITIDNRLSLRAEAGMTFTFGTDGASQREDTSRLLSSLGVNTFFDGSSASDISVNEALSRNPSLLAAASVRLNGDGNNAGRLAGVADAALTGLNGLSVSEFFLKVTSNVAVTTASAREGASASGTVLGSLQAQKENISGVSLDEEAIELVKYERAFQGAARFVSVVDRLTNELIALVN
jgi:flagellar hook-associated protein 1